MKKLGKKFSFITKIMLVIALLFSNLAPLKIVFAYEKSEAVVITKTTDNKLNVRYNEEITDEYLDLVVEENYTYLDGTNLTATNTYDNVLVGDLSSEVGYGVESLLDDVKFDGTYTAVVRLERENVESLENELVAVNEYVEEIKFEVGMTSKVYHADTLVEPVNGVYTVVDGDVIESKLTSGGLAPTWEYLYNETVYTGEALLEYAFTEQLVIANHLSGEHTYEKDIIITSEHFTEDMVYNVSLSLMYGSYADNDKMLNDSVIANGYNDVIEFGGASKNGTLYIYPDLNNGTRVITAYDLIKVLASSMSVENGMSFVVSNGVEELQNKYAEFAATQTELTVTPEEFYAEYVVDENYFVTVSCEEVTVRYDVLYFADVNNDKKVTVDDVLSLIDKVLGLEASDLSKDDINNDKKLNLTDAVYLFEMINSKMLEVTMGQETGNVSGKLEVTNENITSGDTFTVNYVVTIDEYTMNGVAGTFAYDKSALELVEVTNKYWNGNSNKDKFLYLGDEYLELGEPTVSEVTSEEGIETDSTGTEQEDTTELVYPDMDYVIVTAKFKAKKAGEYTLEVKDNTFISGVNTLKNSGESVSTVVVVNASGDNALKSLVVGGTTIELVEGVLDYEMTVGNEVEEISVEAITNNVAANVTSVVAPEKLAEGVNTISITVEAENGDVKIYTVIVTREAAVEEEEETKTQVNYNNTYNENDDDEDKKEEVKEPVVEEEPKEEEPAIEEDEGKLSKIIIIILILLVIAGLIYLIFKDDDDDDTKKANKEVDKLKKADAEIDNSKTSTTKNKSPKKKSNPKERR